MKIIKTIAEFNILRKKLSGSIGFIPTMGYLHEGHISLVKKAKNENDVVIVSVFVNPKQFGPNEDFQKYPRDTQKDISLLENAHTDILFLPDVDELYPDGFETYVSFENISKKLEGEIRPMHFTGVATVLAKLFNLVQPTKSYFGQKDAQQVVVVKKLVTDLNFPVEIIVGETVREPDGLAMSSRNVFLTPDQRKEAAILYQSLCLAKEMVAKGETHAEKIKSAMEKLINTTSGKIDYISTAGTQSLDEVTEIKKETLISLAVRFGSTRLIDNLIVTK